MNTINVRFLLVAFIFKYFVSFGFIFNSLNLKLIKNRGSDPVSMRFTHRQYAYNYEPKLGMFARKVDKKKVDSKSLNMMIEAMNIYKNTFNELEIHEKFEVPFHPPWPNHLHGFRLGDILQKFLSSPDFSSEKYREYFDQLKQIGFEPHIDTLQTDWDVLNKTFIIYKKLYDNLDVKSSFVVPTYHPWPRLAWGMRLGHRVAGIRTFQSYLNGHPERIDMLNALGFKWTIEKKKIATNKDQNIKKDKEVLPPVVLAEPKQQEVVTTKNSLYDQICRGMKKKTSCLLFMKYYKKYMKYFRYRMILPPVPPIAIDYEINITNVKDKLKSTFKDKRNANVSHVGVMSNTGEDGSDVIKEQNLASRELDDEEEEDKEGSEGGGEGGEGGEVHEQAEGRGSGSGSGLIRYPLGLMYHLLVDPEYQPSIGWLNYTDMKQRLFELGIDVYPPEPEPVTKARKGNSASRKDVSHASKAGRAKPEYDDDDDDAEASKNDVAHLSTSTTANATATITYVDETYDEDKDNKTPVDQRAKKETIMTDVQVNQVGIESGLEDDDDDAALDGTDGSGKPLRREKIKTRYTPKELFGEYWHDKSEDDSYMRVNNLTMIEVGGKIYRKNTQCGLLTQYPFDPTYMFMTPPDGQCNAEAINKMINAKRFDNNVTNRQSYFKEKELTPHAFSRLISSPMTDEAKMYLTQEGYRIYEFSKYHWNIVYKALKCYYELYKTFYLPLDYVITKQELQQSLNINAGLDSSCYSRDMLLMPLGHYAYQLRIGDVDGYEDDERRKQLDDIHFTWRQNYTFDSDYVTPTVAQPIQSHYSEGDRDITSSSHENHATDINDPIDMYRVDSNIYLRFRFDLMLLGLKIFQHIHHHVLPAYNFVVPVDSEEWPMWMHTMQLGLWCSLARLQQRVLYKYYQSRVDTLNHIKFIWQLPPGNIPQHYFQRLE